MASEIHAKKAASVEMKGWLFKWTNYVKGFQRRWFVIENGMLSYYRTEEEITRSCRGKLNLQNCAITSEDHICFTVSASQTWHLKATSETDKLRWITTLEESRLRITPAPASIQYGDNDVNRHNVKNQVQSSLNFLQTKLENLTTCQDLICKHHQALQRHLNELDRYCTKLEEAPSSAPLFSVPPSPSKSDAPQENNISNLVKSIKERATLFRITSSAMVSACVEYANAAQDQSAEWERIFNHEQACLTQYEDALECLAKQNSQLEILVVDKVANHDDGECSDDEFFDAKNEVTASSLRLFDNTSGNLGDENEVLKMASKKIRSTIPPKPDMPQNLWAILKSFVGKDLSRIALPVNFSEPLSSLQRLAESLQYYHLLDRAACSTSVEEQILHVAAFVVSTYSTSRDKVSKPFNPLLGETFEFDLSKEVGIRLISEQVSHHPPISALHAEGRGWKMHEELSMTSQFRGKCLQITPLGETHLIFENTKTHYSWRKVVTLVNNVIVGWPWIEHVGEFTITEHNKKHSVNFNFLPHSYLATAHRVRGIVKNSDRKSTHLLTGWWDSRLESAPITQELSSNSSQTEYVTDSSTLLWKKDAVSANSPYYFTPFAIAMNAKDPTVAPTDSRYRTDIRMLEEGNWEEANQEKLRLESKQRVQRCLLEETGECYSPKWFSLRTVSNTNSDLYLYDGDYWTCKKVADWKRCPSIF